MKPLLAGAAVATVLSLTLAAAAYGQPDVLARAKELYAAAAYRDALDALAKVDPAGQPRETAIEIEKYRAFCFLAIGDAASADEAIGRIFEADPRFSLPEGTVSGRVADRFRQARARRLPLLVKQAYDRGRQAYDRKAVGNARDEFQLAMDLASDPEVAPDAPLVKDLQTLASGFMRLLAADTPGIDASPLPVVVLSEPPVLRTIFSVEDEEVVAPVVLVQQFPPWPSFLPSALEGRRMSVLEVVVDENGRVESAVVRPPLHPVYDNMLVESSKAWRYEPARRGSRPVKYRKLIEIVVPGRREPGGPAPRRPQS